jgi:hypothetical protein
MWATHRIAKGSVPALTSSSNSIDLRIPPRWRLGTRIAFRLAFCYLMQYALLCGHRTLLSVIPRFGAPLEERAALLYLLPARWVGVHLFHLTGASAVIHRGAFGDHALDWIAAGLMLAVSVVATCVWSLIDRRRPAYPRLFSLLRWVLRLTLVLSILWYASIKIFPVQIESPSLAVLNEPVGSTSPMTMLWTVLGMNPAYERVCGAIELLCALLLLWRRTALSGVLLALVVLANIVLFDVFFDVPVRLYAANLLLMALTLLAPDVRALLQFLWTQQPVTPRSAWRLYGTQRSVQIASLAFDLLVLLTALRLFTYAHGQAAREESGEQHPPTLSGEWRIEPAETSSGHAAGAASNGDFGRATEIYLEPSGRVTARLRDGLLHGGGHYDIASHTIDIPSGTGANIRYTFLQPDAMHLVLAAGPGLRTLDLTRMPLPGHYPLLDRIHERGLHLVEEFEVAR